MCDVYTGVMWDFVAHITMAPRPKGRPRIGKFRAFTPDDTVRAEKEIMRQLQALGVRHFDYPVIVHIESRFACPKTISNPLPRADVDNLAKLCLDALQPIIIRDDSLVMCLETSKRYCTPAEEGYTIKIRKAYFDDQLEMVQKAARKLGYGTDNTL
jgi:Holliday junction resolvase RusA-like endonuclease